MRKAKAPGMGTLYALFVGINAYPGIQRSLNFCGADAVELYNFFLRDASRQNLRLLTGGKAGFVTSGEIIQALKDFLSSRSIRKNDVFLFFFAGHGIVVGGSFYLLTSNSKLEPDSAEKDNADIKRKQDVLKDCSLPIDELKHLIDQINADNQVLIIDSCKEHRDGVRSVFSQALNESMDEPMKNAHAALAMPRTIKAPANRRILCAVMSSCWFGQCSWEYPEVEHGWFTYHLLRCLNASWASHIDLGKLDTKVKKRMKVKLRQGHDQECHLSLQGGQIFLPVRRLQKRICVAVFLLMSLGAFAPRWRATSTDITYVSPSPTQTPTVTPSPPPTPKPTPNPWPAFEAGIAQARRSARLADYVTACNIYSATFKSSITAGLNASDRKDVSGSKKKCGLGQSEDAVKKFDEIAIKVRPSLDD